MALTVDEIRLFVLDRTVSDNPIDCQLFWEDREIQSAMVQAVRHYNRIHPMVETWTVERHLDDNIMLLGTVYYMYLQSLQRLMRQDLPYQAGGVGINRTGALIGHVQTMAASTKSEFEDAARMRKISINASEAYGRVG